MLVKVIINNEMYMYEEEDKGLDTEECVENAILELGLSYVDRDEFMYTPGAPGMDCILVDIETGLVVMPHSEA